MATQREIIYSVRRILRAGKLIDDDTITDRQVAFLCDALRATLLRQQYDKGQSLSENHIQYIKCLSLESVDTAFSSSMPSDCTVYRTVLEIPTPIETKQKDLITHVMPNEFLSINYDFVPFARIPYVDFTRFKTTMATRFQNRIYLINAPYTEKITVGGVWEKPNALSNYSDCSGSTCFSWDSPYPLSSHLIDPLIKMVTDELLITLKVPIDSTNDGTFKQENPTK